MKKVAVLALLLMSTAFGATDTTDIVVDKVAAILSGPSTVGYGGESMVWIEESLTYQKARLLLHCTTIADFIAPGTPIVEAYYIMPVLTPPYGGDLSASDSVALICYGLTREGDWENGYFRTAWDDDPNGLQKAPNWTRRTETDPASWPYSGCGLQSTPVDDPDGVITVAGRVDTTWVHPADVGLSIYVGIDSQYVVDLLAEDSLFYGHMIKTPEAVDRKTAGRYYFPSNGYDGDTILLRIVTEVEEPLAGSGRMKGKR
jgi:hypothetical protein